MSKPTTINVDGTEYVRADTALSAVSAWTDGPNPPVEVGVDVYVRTVTHHYTGRVERCGDGWLWLSTAAWIADSGRWYDALSTGSLNEVEPMPHGVTINLGSVVDISLWMHDLPTVQK